MARIQRLLAIAARRCVFSFSQTSPVTASVSPDASSSASVTTIGFMSSIVQSSSEALRLVTKKTSTPALRTLATKRSAPRM
jgi:hypothetical protein